MKTQRIILVALFAIATAGLTGGRVAAGNDAGTTLANHQLASFDGDKTTLSALRGDVVVVNFWATWCAPCRKELSIFDGWNAEWKGRGARVVAVSIDKDARKARLFAQDMKLGLTVLHDGPDGLARSLDLPSVPCTYLLDRNGAVVSVIQTSEASDLAALKRKAESLLGSRGSSTQSAGMNAPYSGE